jgi:regulator of replication initiation timing
VYCQPGLTTLVQNCEQWMVCTLHKIQEIQQNTGNNFEDNTPLYIKKGKWRHPCSETTIQTEKIRVYWETMQKVSVKRDDVNKRKTDGEKVWKDFKPVAVTISANRPCLNPFRNPQSAYRHSAQYHISFTAQVVNHLDTLARYLHLP